MTGTDSDDAMVAAVAAALLAQGAALERLSRLLTAVAVAGWLWLAGTAAWFCAAAALAGVAGIYLAIRVGLDAALFRDLARGEGPSTARLRGLDRAMQACGLLPAALPERALAPRVAGARRLLMWQASLLALQLALLGLAGGVR